MLCLCLAGHSASLRLYPQPHPNMKLRTPFFLAVLAMTVSTYCPPNRPAHNTLQERLPSTNDARFVCIAGRLTISTKQIRTPWRSLRPRYQAPVVTQTQHKYIADTLHPPCLHGYPASIVPSRPSSILRCC